MDHSASNCKDGKCKLVLHEKKRCKTIRIPHVRKVMKKKCIEVEVPHWRKYYTEEKHECCPKLGKDCGMSGSCEIPIKIKKANCCIKIPHLEKYYVREKRTIEVPCYETYYTEKTECACVRPTKCHEKKEHHKKERKEETSGSESDSDY